MTEKHHLGHPAIFCCHASSLFVLACYRHPKEYTLWDFACYMSEIISPPPSSTTSNVSSDSSSSSDLEPMPAEFILEVLSQSKVVVQFERWIDGENFETRTFVQIEDMEGAYLELEKEAVKDAGWAWGWSHIKFRCKHRDTFYVLKMLEKVDETGERKKRVNGWTGELERREGDISQAREAMSEANFGPSEREDGNMMFDGQGRSGARRDLEDRGAKLMH